MPKKPIRERNVFDPNNPAPYKLSRNAIEQFSRCPCCFYYDRRLGVSPPPGYPLTLNNAVDELFKKEFDIHRAGQTVHPLLLEKGLDLVPFQHPEIDTWRNALSAGLQYSLPGTNIVLTGGVDDIWQDKKTGKLYIVDYKATSKKTEVDLSADWQKSYLRQVEFYRWLLLKQGFEVADEAYFVYTNARTDMDRFDNTLQFKTALLEHKCNSDWVEATARAAYECLKSNEIPKRSETCEICNFIKAVARVKLDHQGLNATNTSNLTLFSTAAVIASSGASAANVTELEDSLASVTLDEDDILPPTPSKISYQSKRC